MNLEDVKRMVALAIDFGGRIDMVLNNAGVGAVSGERLPADVYSSQVMMHLS